jgi:hypothetical protein
LNPDLNAGERREKRGIASRLKVEASDRCSLWYNRPKCSSKIIGEIRGIETIAVGRSIRDIVRLRKVYGRGRWRKLKGIAYVKLRSGVIRLAE